MTAPVSRALHVSPQAPVWDANVLAGRAGDLGLDLLGVAHVDGLFAGPWWDYPRALSLAIAYEAADLAGLEEGPTASYHRAYGALNQRLNAAAQSLAAAIRAAGYRAEPYAATVASSALDGLSSGLAAAVQHKTVATRAGLGWIGRSALLITPDYGPRVRLATVFTDMPLVPAEPLDAGRCGRCARCVASCPAGAIRGEGWRVGVAREALVDAELCRHTCERLARARVGVKEAICGVCMAVCPAGPGFTRR